MRIVMTSGEPFAFAGLRDSWLDPQGGSCQVLHHHHNRGQRPSPSHSQPDAGHIAAGI